MPRYDFTTQRLHVEARLETGARIALDRAPSHYLQHVLRLREDAPLLLFNGRDGEWSARVVTMGKAVVVEAEACRRRQAPPSGIQYCFAPLKQGRLDYMVQKAVEMGAGTLTPVLTRRTQVRGVSGQRLRANAVEAAEQCGILAVPAIDAETTLERLLADWPEARPLVFCDEDAPSRDPIATLRGIEVPLALLVGPEGGFDEAEREALLRLPSVLRLSLGERILRADTAAVAALALIGAALAANGAAPT